MTRINCINPELLTDQQLKAEYYELLRIPKYYYKSLKSEKLISIPLFYKMGKGHIKFFYDKFGYLEKRHTLIRKELNKRGVSTNKQLNIDLIPDFLQGDWTPSAADIAVNKERIADRIMTMKSSPRYYGEQIGKDKAIFMLYAENERLEA